MIRLILFAILVAFNACSLNAQNEIFVTRNTVICTGDSIYLQGAYRRITNSYIDTFKTAANKDSIVKTILNIADKYFLQGHRGLCMGDSTLINNKYVRLPGRYFDSLKSKYGCDSIIELYLYNIPKPIITKFGASGLSASLTAQHYQWLDCDSSYKPFIGDTLGHFIPKRAGRYAVETTVDGCVDTSDCFFEENLLSLNNLGTSHNIKVYPNPAKDLVHIEFSERHKEVKVKLLNSDGSLAQVHAQTNSTGAVFSTSNLASGVYILVVETTGNTFIKKLVINN